MVGLQLLTSLRLVLSCIILLAKPSWHWVSWPGWPKCFVADHSLHNRGELFRTLGQDGVQEKGAICVFFPAGAASSQGLYQGLEGGLSGGRAQQGSSYTRLNDMVGDPRRVPRTHGRGRLLTCGTRRVWA